MHGTPRGARKRFERAGAKTQTLRVRPVGSATRAGLRLALSSRMTIASLTEAGSDLNPPHIGPAPHPRRNTWMAIAGIALALAMSASFAYWRHQGIGATERLERFQRLYAERCDSTSFSPSASALAKKLYLGSSTLQRTLDEQLRALESGASCQDVHRALIDVDFPLPSSLPPPARSVSIDVRP